ncbi:hypothetical protein ACLK17_19595 [Escherichia coli]
MSTFFNCRWCRPCPDGAKEAHRPPLLITTVSRWRCPQVAESDYCAGGR